VLNWLLQLYQDSWWTNLKINYYERTIGAKFSHAWFDAMVARPLTLENKWERTQVIGLGSVLITTVTFAAAFTIPGGYNNQDHSERAQGMRYSFRAFILANTLAFIQGFISLLVLLVDALPGPTLNTLEFSSNFFQYAAISMVITFGCGLYVTLAPLCFPIAVIIFVITMIIGSPALFIVLDWDKIWDEIHSTGLTIQIFNSFVYNRFILFVNYFFSFMFIFLLAGLLEWKYTRKG
jgi:hypothetical protein